MVSLLTYILALGLPSLGAISAWIAIIMSIKSIKSRDGVPSTPDLPASKLMPFFMHSSTLIIFGFVIVTLLYSPKVQLSDSVEEFIAMTYGITGVFAGLGFTIVYYRGIGRIVKAPELFGRVLIVGILPETSALLGLIVAFYMRSQQTLTIDSSANAAMLMSICGVCGLLSAYLATSFNDNWCSEGLGRALSQGAIGVLISLIITVYVLWYIGLF